MKHPSRCLSVLADYSGLWGRIPELSRTRTLRSASTIGAPERSDERRVRAKKPASRSHHLWVASVALVRAKKAQALRHMAEDDAQCSGESSGEPQAAVPADEPVMDAVVGG